MPSPGPTSTSAWGPSTLPAQQYAHFFTKQAADLRDSLEKAQTRLADMQKQYGITVADERFDIETQRLNEPEFAAGA